MSHRPHAGYSECPHCGKRTVEYQHTLSRGLVVALVQFARACPLGNVQHPETVSSDYSMRSNFQKLRYWELVLPNGDGLWRLTQQGHDFINPPHISLPLRVWTYEGDVVEYDPTAWVNIYDVIDRVDTFWQTEF